MNAVDLLQLLDADFDPQLTKIHLATYNGIEQPLDVYLRGEFDEWQARQTKKNFQLDFVLTLIALPGRDLWLFGGIYDKHGIEEIGGVAPYRYILEERPATKDLNGRMVVKFRRPGRSSYLRGGRWADEIHLHEVRAERMVISEFPGYRKVDVSQQDLALIVRQRLESWRAALSCVAGVYLIADTETGCLYVGSASGSGGIWGRWSAYAKNGHGGNIELRQLLQEEGPGRELAFRYSILEIADIHASEEDVLVRESHWKNVLMSREHGLNAN